MCTTCMYTQPIDTQKRYIAVVIGYPISELPDESSEMSNEGMLNLISQVMTAFVGAPRNCRKAQ